MAPKKSGKKKSGGGKRRGRMPTSLSDVPFEYVPIPVLNTEEVVHSFVKLRISLVTWQHMNTEIRLKTSTTIREIKDLINARHGGTVSNIMLYRDQVHPHNLLTGDHKTLEEFGIYGSGPAEDELEVAIYYDFTPHQTTCPLLMSDINMSHTRSSSIPMLPSIGSVNTPTAAASSFHPPSFHNTPHSSIPNTPNAANAALGFAADPRLSNTPLGLSRVGSATNVSRRHMSVSAAHLAANPGSIQNQANGPHAFSPHPPSTPARHSALGPRPSSLSARGFSASPVPSPLAQRPMTTA